MMKVTEEEIRPQKVFDEYLRLTSQDIDIFFRNTAMTEIACPACGKAGKPWAKKEGFTYKQCETCFTIFVSPRPPREAFDAYYTDSASTKFWATTFYKVTEASRREKLWKPKAQMVKDRIQRYEENVPVKYIVDIGGGYGVFDEEIRNILDVAPVIIEPSVHLANICREKGFTVVEKFMENIGPGELPEGRKCYVSFELFEHLYDPEVFLRSVAAVMNVNDLFIFTTLSGIGLDIQVLGEHAKALSPPHHLNFFNPKSASLLLEKNGFEVLEAITPGKLDVDILNKNRDLVDDPFWKNVLVYLSENEREQLQHDIARLGLSSHMMITCRKINKF